MTVRWVSRGAGMDEGEQALARLGERGAWFDSIVSERVLRPTRRSVTLLAVNSRSIR